MRKKREIAITALCIAVTLVLYILFFLDFHGIYSDKAISFFLIFESVLFIVVAVSFSWGNLVYQFARLGYLRRRASHSPASRDELERFYGLGNAPALTVLIPSYKEEIHVLRQTILSAALLEYPNRRITVLIDNPPDVTGQDASELQATRHMIRSLNEALASLAEPMKLECERFLQREDPDLQLERIRLSTLYQTAAKHLDHWVAAYTASGEKAFAHHDRLFVERVLLVLREEHRRRAAELVASQPDAARITREYKRLAALFSVEIGSFERKRYENLSHEPNKAMNLNSYIGLMGRSFRREYNHGRQWLVEYPGAECSFAIPDSDYVLTLDADSVLLPDYALRLIKIMEADPRIAVAQTPYSAFPGAPDQLERMAGATTDLQYIVHQGFTSCDATYWVGANAMLRLDALKEIVQMTRERGYIVPVFIQDRTVIEDTGSTVDLIARGWKLYNYPERLAYSATPPDFGSLVIQRRRWANGGLIILPALLKHLLGQFRFAQPRLAEAFMRIHYLCSPALSSLGLLAILLYPFDDEFTTVWLVATAVPYYLLYGRDLLQSGYRASDLLRVYALILLLLPVNVSGVLRSIQQMVTGRKSAFARTPKIAGRTASPAHHILFLWLFAAFLILRTFFGLQEARYGHAAFAAANAAAYIYALSVFVGWRNAWVDIIAPLKGLWLPRGADQWPQNGITGPSYQFETVLTIPTIRASTGERVGPQLETFPQSTNVPPAVK